MDTCVVTAIYGGYDDPKPARQQDVACEWVMFTDEPRNAPGWTVRVEPSDEHPRSAAKHAKILPWDLLDHRFVVWVDGGAHIRSSSFVREAVACLNDGMAVWAHPDRDCIYDEAEASLALQWLKYGHLPIREQVEHYRSEGHPPHDGLYACGTVVWDLQSDTAQKIARAWWDEIAKWTWQDQLSLPPVCRRLGLRPGVFPHDQRANPWLEFRGHNMRD